MPRKARARSFLFEPAAFRADPSVRRMSATARGAYISLLCEAWESQTPGVLEDDDELLARLSGCTPDEWAKVRPLVAAAFDTKRRPGFWVQRRLVKTYSIQSRHFSRARAKAISMAKARWHPNGAQPDTCIQHESPMLVLGSGSGSGSKDVASKGALAPVSASDSANSNLAESTENRSPTLPRRVKNPDTELLALQLDTRLQQQGVTSESRKILIAHFRQHSHTIRSPDSYYRPGTPQFEQLLRDLCAKHERQT